MKRFITATFVLLVLAAFPLSHLLMGHPNGQLPRVKICHLPPVGFGGIVIEVNGNSSQRHMVQHGDCNAHSEDPIGSECSCGPSCDG